MESEAKVLQAIFDHAALGIAQISLDGSWLRVNDRYCQMLGYSEAELLTRKIWDVTRPADYDEVSSGRRQLLEGAISSHSIDKRYIRKDGTVFWGRLNRSLVRNHDNVPLYFIAVVEDITERINAERALRDSDQRFTLAQSAAHMAVWHRDLSTNLITFSSEYTSIYGLATDHRSLTYEEWLRLIHPQDREQVRERSRDTITRTHIWDEEFRVVWPDGSVHWLLGKGTVFRDEAGRPVRIVGVNIEITNHKYMVEALRQSEERFRLAVQATNDAVWDIDLVAGTVHWNETYTTLYGRPPETSDSWQWWIDRIHPEDCEPTVGGLRMAINSGASSWKCEYRFRRADGAWAHLYDRACIARDASGKAWRVIGAMHDLTERKEAEAALRESEAYLNNAARLAQVGHWQWNLQTNRVSGSDEMFRIFGKPQEYTPSYDDFLQMVIPQDRERVARWVGDCLAEKRGSEIEYQIAWPNGGLRTISCVSELSLSEEGLPSRMFGACQDITDVKKNEAKLVQAQEDLRALTARLVELQESGTKELARELHDDLSQNLAALGREIETLLPLSAQPSRSLSEQAHEIWRRVTKLASDVHSMSQRLHPTILDDLGLKEALKEQCWAFSERTGIPVQFESAGESTRPAEDVSLCFYRVAQEGLHNIAKHAGATSVHVALSSSEEQCTLRIEDNGQGFDTSEAKGKNALGLISMRERARLVNGNFTIRSEYGKGTMLEVSVVLKTN